MENIKVSVIIPVCNVGKYLRDCLDSVVNQTLHEIEIICVDDFSSDGSAEILKEYASADSRIVTIFHPTNSGTSQARKDGVLASRGKYVMFLDGDDFFARNACEVALDAIVKNSVDMVQFGTNVINLGVAEKHVDIVRRFLKPHLGVLKNADLLRACFKEKKFRFQLWNKIYDGELCRKAFHHVEDGYFPKAQDLYAFFVIARFAKSYAGIEDVLYNYNFGIGVTGDGTPSLQNFKALCAEHDVYEAVKRFAVAYVETRIYDEIMAKKDRELFEECLNMWQSDLKKEDKADAFRKLADTWGATDIICARAEKGWYDVIDALKNVLDKMIEPVRCLLSSRYRRARREVRRQIRLEAQYRYYKELPPEQFPEALKEWYKKCTKKTLNLENPTTFNEKIQWMKVYDATPTKARLTDRYLVREWVAEKIGEKYLIPLLGVYDKFDDINFDKLPDKFVIKTNHDGLSKWIVADKSKFDLYEARIFFNRRMHINYALCSWLDPNCKNIVPKIIIEEYLENRGNILYDYKFMCFDGKVQFIRFQSELHELQKAMFFDTEWNRLTFTIGFCRYERDVEKPENLDEMIKLAETLADGFAHVRVDFFRLNDGTIKFGEMLFSPDAKPYKWTPPEYDKIIGDLIKLPTDEK